MEDNKDRTIQQVAVGVGIGLPGLIFTALVSFVLYLIFVKNVYWWKNLKQKLGL
mgnify:CR=1 FL=1|tara:strand:- start:56 stop:217 length:162 start_codon:yes stop_codon:yes gene_type:complete